jgi:hypothetical protein
MPRNAPCAAAEVAMVSEDAIRERSYIIWERQGRPQGKDLEHWLQAKAELEAEQQPRRKSLTFEYYARLYRFEEWQRAVQPRPRISVPPQVTMAGRVPRDYHPVAA